MSESRRGAALAIRNAVEPHGETPQMGFIDDRVGPRRAGRPVLTPIERPPPGYDSLRHGERAIAAVEGQILPWRGDAVAIQGVAPAQGTRQRPRVRIEEQLVGIVAKPAFRLVGAEGAIAIELAGSDAREAAMPDTVSAFGKSMAL